MKSDKARPKKVSTALKLLYLAFVLVIISSVLNISLFIPSLLQMGLDSAYSGFIIGVTIFIYVLSLGFLAFLIYKIRKGRNWARITFLVLSAIGIPFSIISVILSLTINPLSEVLILSIVEIILETTAIVLLFQKKSSEWFNSKKTR